MPQPRMQDLIDALGGRKAFQGYAPEVLKCFWNSAILELYLNVIEWGSGIFRAEAAARHYFGVSASQLSPEQAARLAAMAPNPRYYERNPGAPGLIRKIGIIRTRMGAAELP